MGCVRIYLLTHRLFKKLDRTWEERPTSPSGPVREDQMELSPRHVPASCEVVVACCCRAVGSLMSDLLPVLQPLQIVTELLCAEKSTSASVVYPLMYKLVNVDGDSARHKQGTRRQICPEQSRDCSTSVYKRDSSGPGNKRLLSVLDGDSSSRLRARSWPCRRGATSRRADASQRAGRGVFSSISKVREVGSKDSVLKVPAVNRRISVTVAVI